MGEGGRGAVRSVSIHDISTIAIDLNLREALTSVPMTPLPPDELKARALEMGIGEEWIRPIQTAIGKVYPPPRLRNLIEGLENIQKRIAQTCAAAHPYRLRKVYAKPKDREDAHERLKVVYDEQQAELKKQMDALEKDPIMPEQMMHPLALISYCCKKATMELPGEGEERKHKCVACGRDCMAYRRADKEEWKMQIQNVMASRIASAQIDREELARKKHVAAPESDKPHGFVPFA